MKSYLAPILGILGLALVLVSAIGGRSTPTNADGMVARAVLPQLAGDNAAGSGQAATSTPQTGQCAGPRSAVRTLSDSAAGFAREASARTLAALLGEAKPATAPESRMAPLESSVVRVAVYLEGVRSGSGGSLELRVANGPGDFEVTAGIPGGSCLTGTDQADVAAINAARVAFLQACGAGGSRDLPSPRVIIEGTPHWTGNGDGAAISLWPVLSFALEDGWTCTGQPPTPTATATPVAPIETLYLSVDPQTVAPGAIVRLTAYAVPAGPGHVCTPFFSEFSPPSGQKAKEVGGTVAKTTGADGQVWWDISIPADTAIGRGSFMVTCDGSGGNSVKIFVE